MSLSLCTARPQAEEEGDLDEVSLALDEGARYVGRLCRNHDNAQRDDFSLLIINGNCAVINLFSLW